MQKELIAGETIIGHLNGKYKGIYRKFNICYGNVADIVVNNKTLHLTELEYRKMLNDFLNSSSGAEYRKPSEEEIISSIKTILNEEAKINNEKNDISEKERTEKAEKDRQEALLKEQEQSALKQKELAIAEEANKLKKLEIVNSKKKQLLTKIVICILGGFNILALLAILYLIFLK